jgi:hypothetical protein
MSWTVGVCLGMRNRLGGRTCHKRKAHLLFWEVGVRFWVREMSLHQRGRKLSEGVSFREW